MCCVVGACTASTNDVFSSNTVKSMYSPRSICCCSWAGTGTESCWAASCWVVNWCGIPVAGIAEVAVLAGAGLVKCVGVAEAGLAEFAVVAGAGLARCAGVAEARVAEVELAEFAGAIAGCRQAAELQRP